MSSKFGEGKKNTRLRNREEKLASMKVIVILLSNIMKIILI